MRSLYSRFGFNEDAAIKHFTTAASIISMDSAKPDNLYAINAAHIGRSLRDASSKLLSVEVVDAAKKCLVDWLGWCE
ncbi:hypothetical protein N9452_04755 [Alphaproteobacteria bacterium]|jgi:hypothetical protein|nr:hypothetical protein [Alphaproteobacteria bacterium]